MEMGSGLGDLLLAVAKTGAYVRGVELSPGLYAISKWRLRKNKRASVQIGSVYDADLSNVDVVFCYLLKPMMKRLEVKFAKELRPGSKVVSFAFPLPNKEATTILPRQGINGRIFLYTY